MKRKISYVRPQTEVVVLNVADKVLDETMEGHSQVVDGNQGHAKGNTISDDNDGQQSWKRVNAWDSWDE